MGAIRSRGQDRLHADGSLRWRVRRWLRRIAEASALMGMAAIIGIMLYSVADVALRYLFNSPLPGAVDVVSYGLGFAVAAVMPYGFVNNDHVSVDFLSDLTKGRARAAVQTAVGVVSTVCVGVLTQRIWIYADARRVVGDRMWILQVEVWPLWYAIAGLFSLTVILLATITILAAIDTLLGPERVVGAASPSAGGFES